ncbi:hypothetical protein AMK59_2511 [Oryctes borbonicus]|uniref:Mannosyltransferase n=1 Tax=Oryctes borbonicus TaxID=1629725 RepID=A0A0T6BEW4_9SCAR|nr:hypothetical protein AMK59_2511 [Oryctes borbonicus]
MQFLVCSGAAILIFRFEVILFLGALLLYDLYYKRVSLLQLLNIVIPAGGFIIGTTIFHDSIFWKRPLWPEGELLWFNIVENKSSDYGTSPFLWYFYSAIPRGMAASVFLIPLGLFMDQRVRKIFILTIFFVFIYSFLPHKELRFIIYAFPFLNIAAAAACHRIWENRFKTPLYHLLSLGVTAHLVVNLLFTLFLLNISTTNYPGGVAITRLHRLAQNETNVHVHIDNLACQTGVTRFLQIRPTWIYNKTEHMIHGSPEMYQYTHLIVEAKSKFSPNLKPYHTTHEIIDYIEAFHQVSFDYLTIPPVKVKTKPVLFLLRRKDDYLKYMPDASKYKEEDEAEVEIEYDESESIESLESDHIRKEKQKLNLEKLRKQLRETYEASDETNDGAQLNAINEKEVVQEKVIEVNKKSQKSDVPKKEDSTSKTKEKLNVQPKHKVSIKDSIRKIKEEDAKIPKSSERKSKKSTGSIEKGRVKENIRNIIKQFKEEQITKSSEEKPRGTKDKIKEIIENEKKILEQEELIKLQSQILSIIESNPNIVNKDSIKEKIENIVSKDANVANLKADGKEFKLKKPVEKKKSKTKDTKTIEDKIMSKEIEHSQKSISGKSKSDEAQVSKSRDSLEKSIVIEDEESSEISDQAVAHFEYDEKMDTYSPLEAEFEAASEHLENIMLMIEEIVSTMEVEEESYDTEDEDD